jgi:membrane associated rhomboid family serine protease
VKIDTIKGLATYGTAAIVILVSIVIVAMLTFSGRVDGATGIAFFASIAGGAVGFLWAAEAGRARQAAFEQGLNTPTPGPPEEPQEQKP